MALLRTTEAERLNGLRIPSTGSSDCQNQGPTDFTETNHPRQVGRVVKAFD